MTAGATFQPHDIHHIIHDILYIGQIHIHGTLLDKETPTNWQRDLFKDPKPQTCGLVSEFSIHTQPWQMQ